MRNWVALLMSLVSGAMLGLGAPGTARAQQTDSIDPLRADLHCVMVGFALAANADATMSQSGTILSIYFVGKIEGRAPDLDLEAAIRSELPNLTDAMFETERVRCGGELRAQGETLIAIGRAFTARPADASPNKP